MLKKFFFSFIVGSLPSLVSACTVCFGGVDSKLAKGFTWGVLVLGSLPFLMLAGFIFIIVHSSRKRQTR